MCRSGAQLGDFRHLGHQQWQPCIFGVPNTQLAPVVAAPGVHRAAFDDGVGGKVASRDLEHNVGVTQLDRQWRQNVPINVLNVVLNHLCNPPHNHVV